MKLCMKKALEQKCVLCRHVTESYSHTLSLCILYNQSEQTSFLVFDYKQLERKEKDDDMIRHHKIKQDIPSLPAGELFPE